MEENPFRTQETQENTWENRSRLESKILTEVAGTHLDELLTAEDYKRFGLDKVNPIEKDVFDWTVYVKECKGEKMVGIKIIDQGGIYDMREYLAKDQNLPLSTKQGLIDEIANQRSKKFREESERKKQELKERMARERGFPEGTYMLYVTYPHRSGVMKTDAIHEIRVETEDTREEVLKKSKSWIQLSGLHNFGLDLSKNRQEKSVAVNAVLKKDKIEVPFTCAVDASGWIVNK